MVDDRHSTGAALFEQVSGGNPADLLGDLAAISPDLAAMVNDFAFGEIYARPGLDLKQRWLVTIAGLTALGHSQPQLKAHIRNGLNVGLSREEITEAILQMAVYAGFPACINAMMTAGEVFADHDLLPKEEA